MGQGGGGQGGSQLASQLNLNTYPHSMTQKDREKKICHKGKDKRQIDLKRCFAAHQPLVSTEVSCVEDVAVVMEV